MGKPAVPRKIGEMRVLEIVKKNQPISIYRLGKLLGYNSYSGIFNYVKELIIKGKLRSKIRLNEDNRAERILFVIENAD